MDVKFSAVGRCLAIAVLLLSSGRSYAGSPPLITDDPETPGYKGWEINITSSLEHARDGTEMQNPLFDINYGLTSDRDQLKVEFAVLSVDPRGADNEWGISDLLVGYKYRFLDEDEGIGWAVSFYPQVSSPTGDEGRGIGSGQSEMLFPFEFQKSFLDHKMWVNPEIGYNIVFGDGRFDRWKIGLATGYEYESGLELEGEVGAFVYPNNGEPDDPFFNLGFQYPLNKNIVLLGSAGRSFRSAHDGVPDFFCLLGVQILLGAAADEENPAHEEGGDKKDGDKKDDDSAGDRDTAGLNYPRGGAAGSRSAFQPYLVNPAAY